MGALLQLKFDCALAVKRHKLKNITFSSFAFFFVNRHLSDGALLLTVLEARSVCAVNIYTLLI